MKKIYLIFVSVLITTISWGQFTEDFNYTSGTTLVGTNGWTIINSSGTTNPFTVNSSGLTYPNSPSNGVGFGVNMTTGGQRVGRFLTAVTTGAAYMSFFVNVSAAGNSTTLGSNFAGMMVGTGAAPGASSRAFIRSVAGGGFNFGVGKGNITSGSMNYESTVRSFGTTYLVVLKYTYNSATSTDDLVSMWINPVLGDVESTPTLTTSGITVGTADVSTSGLTGPALFQRDAASPTCEIDAVRFATTWTAVTPIAVPTLTATPAAPLVIQTVPVNTTSPSVSFNLAGTFLTPAPGTIIVASPNPAFQVSTDNMTFSSSVNIANTTAALAATAVYVRFNSATSGAATVNLTISGGGVTMPPTVTVNAGAGTPYFSKPTGSLHVIGTWGTATDGTGSGPADFISDYQIFTIANRATHTLDDNFQVFGIGSKIVLGNSTDPIKLILPAAFTILNDVDHKVDISNNATLEVANKLYRLPGDLSKTPFPYFGVVDNNSTVEYTWNGTDVTDTVRIPAETFGNLRLTNGLKYFSSGFAFANGTLNITDVAGLNGTGNGSASILVRGNVTLNNSTFDVGTVADANRINLNLGGTTTQTLSGGDFYVNQLRTQAVSSTVPAFNLDIVLGTNTNLITGGSTAGGINLQQPTHSLLLNGNTLTMANGSSFVSTNQGTISGTSTSNLLINKTLGSAAIGTIGFKSGGQVLNDFTFNSAGSGSSNLTLNSALIVNNTLSLVSGNIILGANNLTSAGTLSGGASTGFIVTNGTGTLKRNNVGATATVFPIGPSNTLYHPATLTNTGTADNFSVNVTSAAPVCIDPLASVNATWNITEDVIGGSNCTIALDYTGATTGASYAAASAQVADCGGSTPYYSNGSVTGTVATGSNFTSFSPFSVTSNITYLPVSFISFSGKVNNNINMLNWVTTNEVNNQGFDVLRSYDGQNFSKIGFVSSIANGNAGLTNSYVFNDPNANKVSFYKLRQIDNNNQSKYSTIVKLIRVEKSVLSVFNIGSNPISDNLNINLYSSIKNNVTMQLVDALGKVLFVQQLQLQDGSNIKTIDMSSYKSGIYFLKTLSAITNNTSVLKVVKL